MRGAGGARTEQLALLLREPLLVRVPAARELLQVREQPAHPRRRLPLHPVERLLHAMHTSLVPATCAGNGAATVLLLQLHSPSPSLFLSLIIYSIRMGTHALTSIWCRDCSVLCCNAPSKGRH